VRVLVVTNLYPPHYLGGYELYCRDRVEYLRTGKHEVRVLTSTFINTSASEGDGNHISRELHLADPSGHPNVLRYAGYTWKRERHNARVLQRHIADFKPDVINWWNMEGLPSSLVEWGHRAGIPAVGVVCSGWPTHIRRMANGRFRSRVSTWKSTRFLEHITGVAMTVDLSAAARWLFISEDTRRRTLHAGQCLQDTGVVRAGVDRSLFPFRPGLPWRWRLLYLGRLDHRKGIDTIISALPILPATATLTVVGSGDQSYTETLRQMVDDSDLADRVTFIEQIAQDQLSHIYGDADVLVCPFRWAEPSGGVLLEAMSSGTLVVATGSGGSGEYLRSEVDALLFEPDDVRGLAAQLLRLANDAKLRSRLREGGLHTATRFTSETWGRSLESELQSHAMPKLASTP
jgi:glycogen(starch) synthase